MPHLEQEDGFALPFTIFLVTLITIMLAASFTRAATETLVAGSTKYGVTALSIARSGLDQFLADTFTVRPNAGDSIRYNATGGYADVWPELVQNPADTTEDFVYAVRSRGAVIEPAQGSEPVATRTIAQLATWQTGKIDALAAWTGAAGVERIGGGFVMVHGLDETCGTGTQVPTLRIPVQSQSYGVDDANGLPPIEADSSFTVAALTGIDWNSILAGEFEADYDYLRPWQSSSYPSQLVGGDTTLADAFGYGLLIVTGDLRVSGFFSGWRGLILVGGEVRFESTFSWINGAVVSGLNMAPLAPIGRMGGSGRNLMMRYSPCQVTRALESVTGFRKVSNTWIDNWASY